MQSARGPRSAYIARYPVGATADVAVTRAQVASESWYGMVHVGSPTRPFAHALLGRVSTCTTRRSWSYATLTTQRRVHLRLEIRVGGGKYGGDVVQGEHEFDDEVRPT